MRVHEYVTEQLKPVISYYKDLAAVDVKDYEQMRARLTLPVVSQSILTALCDNVSKIFLTEPSVLEISQTKLVVVGNLHGHLLDLFRIMNRFGVPPETKYLFLGDFVNEGEFSTEVVTILFALKHLYRDSVFLIRGNHEFSMQCQRDGFSAEICSMYGNNTIANAFMHAFACLPLAAVVNSRFFCAHSGIPSPDTLDSINAIKRPLYEIDDSLVRSLLLAVPARPGAGSRPTSPVFGQKALIEFLDRHHFDAMIRSHDFAESGFEEQFDGKLISLFSASTYHGVPVNKACAIQLKEGDTRDIFSYPASNVLRKSAGVRITNQMARLSQTTTPPPVDQRHVRATSRGSRLPTLGLVEVPQKRKMKTERDVCKPMSRRNPKQRHTVEHGKLRKEMGRVEQLTGIRLSNTYSSLVPLRLNR